MKLATRFFLLAVLAAGLAALTACNGKDKEIKEDKTNLTEEETDKAKLVTMEAAIDDLIGEAACEGAEDCRAIGFGAKPCGGPWKFKVYAASAVDTTKLQTLVDEYNEFNRALNEKHGWLSDCMVVMPPEVECVEGRCVAIDNMKVKPVE